MTLSLPTLFLSHGAPTMALQDTPTTRAWRALALELPKPKALIVISAHHQARVPTLTGASLPVTIHDFSGFPDALYALHYAARGAPELARQVAGQLQQAGFATPGVDATRGIDHGVWVPLRHMYPEADVPVLSLSVSPCEDASWHYRLGLALASLRAEGVLIIGSGGLTHNLGALDWHGHDGQVAAWAQAFADWFLSKLQQQDIDALLEWRQAAPEALRNHPTPEHLLPIFVAMGAAGVGFVTDVIEPRFEMGSLALHALRFR
jgi:4,5-DOPA dioxygenase extradiol